MIDGALFLKSGVCFFFRFARHRGSLLNRSRTEWRRHQIGDARPRPRMDLQAFIVRGQVLSLMRKALRAARQAPPESRAEIRAEIRRSFEASRHHDDSRTIKHLLSDGRILVKQLKEMVGLTS